MIQYPRAPIVTGWLGLGETFLPIQCHPCPWIGVLSPVQPDLGQCQGWGSPGPSGPAVPGPPPSAPSPAPRQSSSGPGQLRGLLWTRCSSSSPAGPADPADPADPAALAVLLILQGPQLGQLCRWGSHERGQGTAAPGPCPQSCSPSPGTGPGPSLGPAELREDSGAPPSRLPGSCWMPAGFTTRHSHPLLCSIYVASTTWKSISICVHVYTGL